MKATILEAEKVREVERVDDVEVEDQGQDGYPSVDCAEARSTTSAKRTAKTSATNAKRTANASVARVERANLKIRKGATR